MKPIKSIQTLVTVGAAAALLAACIPSVNPFYTAKEIHFEAQLLGEWQQKDGDKENWKFERGEDQGYKLTITDKDNKKATCDAVLFKLKDELFLDLIPNDVKFAADQADIVGAAMFPGHLLARVSLSNQELNLAFFDFDWLEKYLKENPKALAHHSEQQRLLLTAATPELQRFVLRHQAELFQTPTEFVRR